MTADPVSQLLDKSAIHDLMMRWCIAVDRQDSAQLAALVHDDAVIDLGMLRLRGDELTEHVEQGGGDVAPFLGSTTQLAGNELISLDGNRAVSELYFVSWTRDDGDQADQVLGGRYLDTLERRDGEWKIAHRQVVCDWTRVDPIGALWPPHRAADPPTVRWSHSGPGAEVFTTFCDALPEQRWQPQLSSEDDRQAAIRYLLDRRAIHDTFNRYCRAADRMDPDLMASAYFADAIDDHGFFTVTGAEMVEKCRQVSRSETKPTTSHFVATELVHIDGDEAVGHQSFLLRQRSEHDGRTGDDVLAGRYIDRLARRDGRWRLSDRQVVFDWVRFDPVDEYWPPRLATSPPPLEWGTPSRSDLVYRHPAIDSETATTFDEPIDDEETAVQTLVAREAVHEVLMRYCRGADRSDPDLIETVYYPDAFDAHGFVNATGAEMVESCRAQQEAGPQPGQQRKTMHFAGNELIEIHGDRAASELYFIAFHRYEDGPDTDFVLSGRYVDELERRDGEWRLLDRRLVFDWGRHDPVVESGDAPLTEEPGVIWGQRFSKSDPVYQLGSDLRSQTPQ